MLKGTENENGNGTGTGTRNGNGTGTRNGKNGPTNVNLTANKERINKINKLLEKIKEKNLQPRNFNENVVREELLNMTNSRLNELIKYVDGLTPENINKLKTSNSIGGKKSVSKKPVSKKPVSKKPVSKKPVSKKPVSKKPVSKKPVSKKPISKKSVSKKSVSKK